MFLASVDFRIFGCSYKNLLLIKASLITQYIVSTSIISLDSIGQKLWEGSTCQKFETILQNFRLPRRVVSVCKDQRKCVRRATGGLIFLLSPCPSEIVLEDELALDQLTWDCWIPLTLSVEIIGIKCSLIGLLASTSQHISFQSFQSDDMFSGF